jgi:hypothetical protein
MEVERERENIKASYGLTDEQLDELIDVVYRFNACGLRTSLYDLLDLVARPHVRFPSS